MANPALAGWVGDSVGAGVDGVTVNAYVRNDTATVIATTTTAGGGVWSIADASVANVDVELVNGTEITRFKYDDKIAITQMDVQTQVIRNDSATSSFAITFTPPTLTAHRAVSYQDKAGNILVDVNFQNDTDMVYGTGVFVEKTADQSRTDTTLTSDLHLKATLSSAVTYALESHLFGSFGSTGKPIVHFDVPANSSLKGGWHGYSANDVQSQATGASSNQITPSGTGGSSFNAHFIGHIRVTDTPGDITLQWRQETADATATFINNRSWLSVTRISS